MTPIRRGQIVIVETVDQGRGDTSTNTRKPSKVTRWRGQVFGPSPLGHDLWLIKPVSAGRGKTGTYTVPRHEIVTP